MITLSLGRPRFRTRGLMPFFALLVAIAGVFSGASQPVFAQEGPAAPPLEVEGGDQVKLGQLAPQETQERVLKVFNRGDKPIRLERAMGSCSCIKGTVSTDPIQPGEAATVSLSMQAIINDGVQKKELFVFAEGYKRPLAIHVEADVVDPNPIEKIIKIEPQVVNAGFIRPGEKVYREVTLTNNGTEPIQFARVSSTCTCVQGELLDDLTAPGESAKLRIMIEGRDIGPINQTLTVWFIGARKPLRIQVTADVTLPIKAEPFFINMAVPPQTGESGENPGIPSKGKIVLKSVDDQPFRVVSAGGKKPVLGAGDENVPALTHTVVWDFTGVPDSEIQPWWIIETDHPDARLIEIRVLHPKIIEELVKNQGPWTLAPDRLVVPNLAPGESYERTVKLLKTKGQEIESVSVDSPMLTAEIVGQNPMAGGLEVTIRLTASADASGLIRSKLNVKADGVAQSSYLYVRIGS